MKKKLIVPPLPHLNRKLIPKFGSKSVPYRSLGQHLKIHPVPKNFIYRPQ